MNILNDAMRAALEQATHSPDPSTQNGAVLMRDDGKIYGQTAVCNEFPEGVAYLSARWERPTKYSFIEHAERNAIYAAAKCGIRTDGMWMVCVWAACDDCARAIIQAGISDLVTLAPKEQAHGHWDASISTAMQMLNEAGVRVTYLPNQEFPDAPTLRRDGKPWTPC